MERIAALLQDRLKVLEEIEEEHCFFFQEPPAYQEEAVEKFLRQAGVGSRLTALKERLSSLSSFDTPVIEQTVRGMVAEQHLEAKDLIHPARGAPPRRGGGGGGGGG